MNFWPNGRLQQDDEPAILDRSNLPADLFGADLAEQDLDDAAASDVTAGSEDTKAAARPVKAVGAGSQADKAGGETPGRPVAGARAEASFSRDLVDTYFRQMGNAELLSREEEVALAQRIEAAQQAVLRGLCRVPMLVDRIVRWGDDWREGRLRPDQIVDASMADPDLSEDGAALEPGAAPAE